MILFELEGPFEVKRIRETRGYLLDHETFWEGKTLEAVAGSQGCYIFALRNSHSSYKPYYVGKTAGRFDREIFADHKLNKYHRVIARHKGTPVFFFVVLPRGRGQVNKRAINALEKYLIQAGAAQNPDIQNFAGVKPQSFGIRGVLGERRGANAEKARAFRNAMGFD